MRILYYDCFAGISGDMNLGAMIDLGVDADSLVAELKKLHVDSWTLSVSRQSRGGISGIYADVRCVEHHSCNEADSHGHHMHHHRSFADIKNIINESALSDFVKTTSLKIFSVLAEAEGCVHGKAPDEVAFHEVGAVDSIVDIVGCALCIEMLKVDSIISSTVELGGGNIKCAHGILPVPAPATAILAEKFPSKLNGAPHECTTPTGAAIIAALATGFNTPISGKIVGIGTGVGSRDNPDLPNVLRASLIESDDNMQTIPQDASRETLVEFSSNIDDMTSENISYLCEKLFEASALDVWQESIFMKKGRVAVKVCALCREKDIEKISSAYFSNSTSLGIRYSKVSRIFIRREKFFKNSPFGKIGAKRSFFKGEIHEKMEFDDLKKIAERSGLPIKSVLRQIEENDAEGK